MPPATNTRATYLFRLRLMSMMCSLRLWPQSRARSHVGVATARRSDTFFAGPLMRQLGDVTYDA
jgi:hypothetical protein